MIMGTNNSVINFKAAGTILVSILLAQAGFAQSPTDLNVSNSGASAYIINSATNPTLTLVRGTTYTFHISASGHPFWIKTVRTTGTGSAYNSGVTGNGTQSGTLTFTVPNDAPDQLYYICQYHSPMTGNIAITSAVGTEPETMLLPRRFELLPNYPNPFNPATTIRMNLAVSMAVQVDVYNLLGERLVRLLDRELAPGYQTVRWNGRSGQGSEVPTGIYLVKVTAGKDAQIRKISLIK